MDFFSVCGAKQPIYVGEERGGMVAVCNILSFDVQLRDHMVSSIDLPLAAADKFVWCVNLLIQWPLLFYYLFTRLSKTSVRWTNLVVEEF